MNVKISNANSIQELCDQLRTVCPNNIMKGDKFLVSHNGNTFHIKRIEGMDNTFDVSLPMPVGLNILGTVIGMVIAFVTGFNGFIGIFACVCISLLVISIINKTANTTKLQNFTSLIGGSTNEGEGFSNKEDRVDSEKTMRIPEDEIEQRVLKVVQKKLSHRHLNRVIDGNTSLHDLRADLLDYVEIELGLEEEFNISFPKVQPYLDDTAAARYYKISEALNEQNFNSTDIGTIKLLIDVVREMLQLADQVKALQQSPTTQRILYQQSTSDTLSGNYKQGIIGLTLVAEAGLTEAQYNLGEMYHKGRGVQMNFKQAAYWYQKAVEGDTYGRALTNLGIIYYNGGLGIEKDREKSKRLLEEAAEIGNTQARDFLNESFVKKQTDNYEVNEDKIYEVMKKIYGDNFDRREIIPKEMEDNLQTTIDKLWEEAVAHYEAKDFSKSLEIAQKMEKMKTFSSPSLFELIASDAFMLGDFKLAISACVSAFKRDKKAHNASLMFVNVWSLVEDAANYMLEKNENVYEVPFPKRTLGIHEVVELLKQIGETEAAIYSIGLPKIEQLRWKLSLKDKDTNSFTPLNIV